MSTAVFCSERVLGPGVDDDGRSPPYSRQSTDHSADIWQSCGRHYNIRLGHRRGLVLLALFGEVFGVCYVVAFIDSSQLICGSGVLRAGRSPLPFGSTRNFCCLYCLNNMEFGLLILSKILNFSGHPTSNFVGKVYKI